MKKLVSLILALTLCFSLASVAFAANNETHVTYDTSTDISGDGYVLVIPEDVTLNTTGVARTLGVEQGGMIPYGKKLDVTITSANYADGNFNVVNAAKNTDKLTYTITKDNSALASGNVALSSTADQVYAGNSTTLTLKLTGTPKYLGVYNDLLTFTAAVVDAA